MAILQFKNVILPVLMAVVLQPSLSPITPEKLNANLSLISKQRLQSPAQGSPVHILTEAAVGTKSAAVTAQNLISGESQIRKMMQDRPEMRRYVKLNDPVWTFCVRQFAGEAVGEPILWNNDPPEYQDGNAENQGPLHGEKGWIRVRPCKTVGKRMGRKRSGEEMWSDAIFELFNIHNSVGFNRLYDAALADKVSRQDWITGNTELEYVAERKMASFYKRVWQPNMKIKGIVSHPETWQLGLPDTYEEWIAQYTDKSSYPWNIWGKYYDEQIVPYLKAVRKQKSEGQ